MIKRCPECNRTYSDESISFCLADGALLSAPYDNPREDPPPTEILPSSHAPIPPTSPPKQTVSTITSLGGPGVSPFEADEPQTKRRQSTPFIWAALAFVVVGAIVLGIFGVRRVLTTQTETAATSTSEDQVAQSSPSPTSNPENPTSISMPTPSSRTNDVGTQADTKTTSSPQSEANATPAAATAQADPVLFPPNSKSTPAMTASPATDYSRVFNSREVDSKARILSKPPPHYTEEARKNQVNGTVILRVVFSSTGSVTNISVVRSLPNGLSEQAIAAARKIKFEPAMKDGRPVSVSMLLEYNFNLY